jgi:phosphoribosyl 1,2-cyclic phosphodiesterase
MKVFVLGTGSSGNCLVVEAEGERLLVDAGMGPTRATERMRALGADLVTSRAPLGLFVTHDHGDHAAHALQLARALRAPLFLHPGVTLERACSRRKGVEERAYVTGRPVVVGPFVVDTLLLPHDAPQVAVRVSASGARGGRFAIATDLGHAPRGLQAMLAATDLAMLESNYCPRMLEAGPYPMHLKRRVGGTLGHLANEDAAKLAAELEDTRLSRLVLVHLSRTNNTPGRALEVVAGRVKRLPVEVMGHGEGRVFEVEAGAGGAGTSMKGAEQLGLFP